MEWQTCKDTVHTPELGGHSFWVGFHGHLYFLDDASSLRGPDPFWLFGLIFFFAGFGVGFGAPIRQLVAYRNTEYLITDQRLVTQTGAIGLDTRYLDLDKIQEVYVQVGFIDKMFGTGTIFAVTAGASMWAEA